MTYTLQRQTSVAATALRKAWEIAHARFRTSFQSTVKGPRGDLVTDIDVLCEKTITDVLKSNFPDYSILVEETDDYLAAGPWSWIVDPLDGTNNYAYGLPLWGLSVALCHDNEPVLACIADGCTGCISIASKAAGVTIDGTSVAITESTGEHLTSAFWMGYDADRSSDEIRALLGILARSTRRTFENWAPTVDVGLYFQGGIDLIVGNHCSGTELPAVLLTLREAGARIVDIRGADIALGRLPEIFVAGQSEPIDRFLDDFDLVFKYLHLRHLPSCLNPYARQRSDGALT